MTPPPTRRSDVVDVLHGLPVPDPYRWLEDPDDPETVAWVAAQAAYAQDWLDDVPTRAELVEQLTAIWDRPTAGAPSERGGRWFQWRNTGLQAQPVLYSGPSPTSMDDVLLDPNALSGDGTVAVSATGLSHDGTLMAYATSVGGSDWMTWHVRDVATGDDTPDVVEHGKFDGPAWLPDGSGFLYCAPAPPAADGDLVAANTECRVLLHLLGTPQSADRVVYATPEHPDWFSWPAVSEDGRWLAIAVASGTDDRAQLHVRDLLAGATAPFVPVVGDMQTRAALVANDDDTFYLLTDHLAERGRLVAVDLAAPQRESWREVIGPGESTLLSVHEAGDGFLAHRLRDAASELVLHARGGRELGRLAVEPATTVSELSARSGSPLVHWTTTSATDPGSLWQHDLTSGETRLLRRTPVELDLSGLVSEQVFVTSADGTQIPVFLTHRADVTPTGDVPALVYGYGGFNHPVTPSFASSWALWVQRGGLLAVACLRGGGEYGTAWHDAGRLRHKENVFDDACAVASWLHTSGWSSPARTALTGRSNGGLLAAACLLRRPDLFGAVVPEVGVLDMVRFPLFTVGWAWTSDYGDPADADDFAALMRYSPLHRVRVGQVLPPVLITTGDHDDRVVPAHSLKFAAALQHAAPAGAAPVLLRVDIAAGHGAGKPTAKSIAERADVLAFLERALGVTPPGAPSGPRPGDDAPSPS